MTNRKILLRIPRFDVECCLDGEGETVDDASHIRFVVSVFGIDFEIHKNGDVGIYLHILIAGCVVWIGRGVDVK